MPLFPMSEEGLSKKEGDAEEQLQSLPTSIEAALVPSNKNIIITEPTEPFRIVHVNEAWCRSCGFDAEEVLGQTCRLMQGPGTCRATLKMLRQALLLRRHFAVQLLNYSKQGRPFMNTLQVGPLFNAGGQVTHFIGVVIARYLDGGALVPPSVQQLGTPAMGEEGEDREQRQAPLQGEAGVERSVDEHDRAVLMRAPTALDGGECDEEEQKFHHHEEGGSLSGGRVPPFLTKLCEILTAETVDIVTISPESASFTIWDPNRFAKEVLPRYFKHNKLGSFSQQLHTYGFRRRTTSVLLDTSIEFYHEQYNGDSSEFLSWIRAGGAISKRTTHTRPTPSRDGGRGGVPPQQLLNDMWHVQEGLKQLAMTFQQVGTSSGGAHALPAALLLASFIGCAAASAPLALLISSPPPLLTQFSPHAGQAGARASDSDHLEEAHSAWGAHAGERFTSVCAAAQHSADDAGHAGHVG